MAELPHFSGPNGYESNASISVRGVGLFVLCWAVGMGGILWGVAAMQRGMTRGGEVTRERETPAQTLPQPLQPSPGHPSLDWQDMSALRRSQQQRLNSSGADHIPIDDAIDQLLRSGALTRPWQNSGTQPYRRPPSEEKPTVENRT